jgi:para-aminobenzoate synthetase component II
MILIIDNYDSFTYNLVQRLGELDPTLDIRVYRNDKISLDEIAKLAPDQIIVSPGPCTPLEAGISNDVIRRFGPEVPLLGVCLGHQCIGHVFGAVVDRADRIMHGKTSMIHHDGTGLFEHLPSPLEATRYHSLIIKNDTLPPELEINAWTDDDEIMGVRHREHPISGVQFHPESFLTGDGPKLLANFVGMG